MSKTDNAYRHKLIKDQLISVSTEEKSVSMKRYFPSGLDCIGAVSADINATVADFRKEHANLSPDEFLDLAEYMLANSEFHEEILVAYGLIQNLVKRNYSDALLERFEYWLENYANNWALVDDLCIKAIYNFLLSRPHLIEKTQHWADSKVSWCRRASCVVWVKYIKRKIGNTIYELDTDLVFKNSDKLIADDDEFVQKGVGWLLKVTAIHHQAAVVDYLRINKSVMQKSTIRYALEKVPKDIREEFKR